MTIAVGQQQINLVGIWALRPGHRHRSSTNIGNRFGPNFTATHTVRKGNNLLPTGSEERGVLGVGSIPVAILPSCQVMESIAL